MIDKIGFGYLRYLAVQILQSLGKRDKDATDRILRGVECVRKYTELTGRSRVLCIGARNRIEPDLWRARGMFLDVQAIDLLPARGVRWGDMHRLPYQDRQFSLVVASHVLEHAWDLHQAIREIERVLARPGFLYAALPVEFTPNAHDRWDVGDLGGLTRFFHESFRVVRSGEIGEGPGRELWALIRFI